MTITVPPPAVMAAAAAMSSNGLEPRRHHTVPRFYLRRWAQNDRVRVTNVENDRRSYVAPTGDASIVTDFYRLNSEVAAEFSPVMWEAWLSGIENRATPLLDVLRDDGPDGLTFDQRGHLAMFLATCLTRTRGHLERERQSLLDAQRAILLDVPADAIAHQFKRLKLPADAAAIAQTREEMLAGLPNFASARRTRSEELSVGAEAAATVAVLLMMRQLAVYSTPRPILTCDEPLIELHPNMGRHTVGSGGIWGSPYLLFPLDPRHVLVMGRPDLPHLLPSGSELSWRETLDVNSVVAGAADRLLFAQPSVTLADKIYVPVGRTRAVTESLKSEERSSVVHLYTGRRWHGERYAPQQPIERLWFAGLPPAPPMPPYLEKELKRLRADP